MEDKDPIKDLFSQRLKEFEAPVSPQVWSAVSSSIASTSTVVSSGISMLTKWIIGTTIAAATATGIYMSQSSTEPVLTIKSHKSIQNSDNNSNTPKINLPKQTDQSVVVGKKNELFLDVPTSEHVATQFNELTDKEQTIEAPEPVLINELGSLATEQQHSVKSNSSTPLSENRVTKQQVTEQIVQEEKSKEVEVNLNLPNIFSPNGDGSNDYFYINDAHQLHDFSVAIMDLSNRLVYSSAEPNFKWDGTDMQGNPLPAGKYMYIVIGQTSNQQLVRKFSYLQLVK